jgi:hypothetical protein
LEFTRQAPTLPETIKTVQRAIEKAGLQGQVDQDALVVLLFDQFQYPLFVMEMHDTQAAPSYRYFWKSAKTLPIPSGLPRSAMRRLIQ